MPNKLVLGGFTELRAELQTLPQDCQRDSAPILLRYARVAEAQVKAAYPSVSGTLRAGVKVVQRTARGVASLYTLASTAYYAHIFEFGSRHQRPRPTLLPISERERRASVVAVSTMVESKGLTVRGTHD